MCTSVVLASPAMAAAPGAPTGLTATAGNGRVSLTWTAPSSTGGSPISRYEVYSGNPPVDPQATQYNCTFQTATSCVVSGLTNTTSYNFVVFAENGDQYFSQASDEVSATPGVPGAPTIGTATADDTTASVTFTPPAADGGSAITGFTVTATDTTNSVHGGETASGSGSPIAVAELTNGDRYTFSVTATNDNGTGIPSASSAAVTPSTLPDAPAGASASNGDASASVSFTVPASDGGSAITGYTVTATDATTPANGGQTGTGTSSPITVTGLTNGDSYTFTVTATNADGTGPWSAPSNGVTPVASHTSNVVFTSPANVTLVAGKRVNEIVTATGTSAPTISASDLPAWLTFTPGSKVTKPGKLRGTSPAAGGVFTFTLTGTNGTGSTSETFTVDALAVSSPATANFTVDTPGSFTVTTVGGVTALTAAGLPAGLTFTDQGDGTATISGSPAAIKRPKTFHVKVSASSHSTMTKQRLALTVGV